MSTGCLAVQAVKAGDAGGSDPDKSAGGAARIDIDMPRREVTSR